MTRLALVFILAACGSAPDRVQHPNAAELDAVAEAVAAWTEAGLEELGEDCARDRPRIRIHVARDHREMFSASGYCGPTDDGDPLGFEGELWCQWGRAHAAYRRAGGGLVRPSYPLFVVWHGANREAAVRHEAVHWLQECTGRGYVPQSPHADREVWCPQGCPGRWRRGGEQ